MILGVDIGGANLKLADSTGRSLSAAFPMWTRHQQLGASLSALVADFCEKFAITRPVTHLAVTMTGELADCFATRREGVSMILDQVALAFPPAATSVYAVGGQWLTPAEAKTSAWSVAASNWYALSKWLLAAETAGLVELQLIVDIGSTTTDIIPVKNREIETEATTDRLRLQLGQLVYTGMQRTAVAAIVSSLVIDSQTCPVMAERFATSDDAYLALGLIDEVPQDLDTADGRPRTSACAEARLARMVGEDSESLTAESIKRLAQQIINAQATQLAQALKRNLPTSLLGKSNILASGHGRPLLERALTLHQLDCNVLWLEDIVNPMAARCGPALAVAWLYENRELLVTATP